VAAGDFDVLLAAPGRARAANILIEKESRANDAGVANAS